MAKKKIKYGTRSFVKKVERWEELNETNEISKEDFMKVVDKIVKENPNKSVQVNETTKNDLISFFKAKPWEK